MILDSKLFEQSIRLYQSAHLAEALDLIPEMTADLPYLGLLRARLLSRLGRHEEALKELKLVFPYTNDLLLEVEIVRTFALLSLQRYVEVEISILRGRNYLSTEHSIALETEFHYVEAAYRFMLDDDTAASKAADRALSASDDFFTLSQHSPLSVSVLTHNRAKALQVLALVHSRRKQYHEQGRLNRLAIKELSNSLVPDAYTSALLKMNLSYYVRDLDSIEDARYLSTESWPKELNWLIAEINRSLALIDAVRGDFESFGRKLDDASLLTSSLAFKVLLVTDRSYINRYAFGIFDRESIIHCYFELIKLPLTDDQYYRDALLFLAQEISFFDSSKSQDLLDRFPTEKISDGPLRLHDDREKADDAFALATIKRNSGEDAAGGFFEAFETWNNVGYRKKAAMAAIELAELTQNPTFSSYARREAELRPGSWLDLRVRRMNV